jgi:hypothetical protein
MFKVSSCASRIVGLWILLGRVSGRKRIDRLSVARTYVTTSMSLMVAGSYVRTVALLVDLGRRQSCTLETGTTIYLTTLEVVPGDAVEMICSSSLACPDVLVESPGGRRR